MWERLWNNLEGNKSRLEKWKDIPCSWKGKRHYKYTNYAKLIHKINIILIKIPVDIFWSTQADSKVYVGKNEVRITRKTLKRKSEEELILRNILVAIWKTAHHNKFQMYQIFNHTLRKYTLGKNTMRKYILFTY